MVRLLPYICALRKSKPKRFQSHNGAIAASNEMTPPSKSSTVSIPQWCDCCRSFRLCKAQPHCGFNPTMVRLLPEGDKGFIILSPGFNPTMVRLLPPFEAKHHILLTEVSIPQWCDCCQHQPDLTISLAFVSIPQWCDCCVVNESPKR